MHRKQRTVRLLAAVFGTCTLLACSATPPVRINEDGQRVQRVCEEEQSASGSRLNARVCRDVVVGEAESAAAGEDAERD